MVEYLAHSGTELHPEGQALTEHLSQVANIAKDYFDDPFFSKLAEWIGLYHDAGKYKPAVQRHIKENNKEKVDHATMGARLLSERFPKAFAALPAMPILGHHGGMPDGAGGNHGRSMEARLSDPLPEEAVSAFQREMGQDATVIPWPRPNLKLSAKTQQFEMYMAIHMLHSALVDADFLDTERFYKPEQAELRGKRPPLADLLERFERHMLTFHKQTAHLNIHPERHMRMPRPRPKRERNISRIRATIQAQCARAAQSPQGFFSLTVPTGGGKTLSSLGFALHHAEQHSNIKRIVYAIPFTSIIEQNAGVFRKAVGADAVLEHHSAVAPPEQGTLIDLATENWDAPLVVTTNVQLFESLFSNKPSKCRKLHNLRDSIIILDEMQALPDEYIRPCLMALHSLVTNHRATVVICTATQPNYDQVWPEKPDIFEIIPDADKLYDRMRRTRMVNLGEMDDDQLIVRLESHEQALCIVNNRAHALSLQRKLGGEERGAFYLSTLMCAAHRSRKLEEIRERLCRGERCRLVSTSLIEAGVDVDFPVVYRAAAGLDSLIQAAGRCNRNMRNPGLADVYVFTPVDRNAPAQIVRLANMTLNEIATNHPDLMSREAIAAYFRLRFGPAAELDKQHILRDIADRRKDAAFPFATIAHNFNLIQSAGEAIFVPYDDDARALIAQMLDGKPTRGILRKLQRYSVTVYENQRKELEGRKFLRRAGDILTLDVSERQLGELYTEESGLDPFGKLSFELYEENKMAAFT